MDKNQFYTARNSCITTYKNLTQKKHQKLFYARAREQLVRYNESLSNNDKATALSCIVICCFNAYTVNYELYKKCLEKISKDKNLVYLEDVKTLIDSSLLFEEGWDNTTNIKNIQRDYNIDIVNNFSCLIAIIELICSEDLGLDLYTYILEIIVQNQEKDLNE